MGTLIHKVAHGLIADQRVYLVNLVGGLGLDSTELYFVLAAGLTANDFAVSLTSGGAAVVYTTDITDGAIVTNDTYASVSDGNMSPPTAPSAPGSCVLTSDAQLQPDGSVITRLIVTVTQPTSATLRNTIVTVIGGSNTVGTKVVIPVGLTEGSIPSVIPGVSYVGTAISYDTFGLASSSTTSAAHVAAGDTTAPAQVTSLAALGAIRGALVSWAGSTATDLSHYELQIDSSNTFGTATTYKVKVSVASIVQLAVGTWYFRVRAVDLTGNAGSYSATVSAVSRLVAGNAADIAANSITANDVLAGSITADRLTIGARQTGSSGNQVLNNSFEDLVSGVPVSWTLDYEVTGGASTYATDAVNFKHGARSHFIAVANTSSGGVMASKSWPVAAGEVFYLSCWVLAGIASADGLYLRSLFGTTEDFGRNDVGVTFTDLVNDGPVTTSWVQYQGYVTVPAGKTWMRFALYNWQPATLSTMRFDNVVCERVAGGISNSVGTVVIDASGITITNGKLTMQDEFGKSVLGASGFSGNWGDFIATGLYNGRFLSGAAGAIGSGRSAALPYWTLADITGSPVATFAANAGVAVTFAALSNKKSFTSDSVQVHPAAIYQCAFTVSANKGGGTLFLVLAPFIDWYQADGTTASAITATTTLDTSSFSATLSATALNNMLAVRPPADARFAKLRFTVEENAAGTHTAGNSLTILSASLKEVANTSIGQGAAFPASPLTYDRFFHTGYQMEFFYQGSRWVSAAMFCAQAGMEVNTAAYTLSFAASSQRVQMTTLVPPVGSDVWIESITLANIISSGGTALGASHKWVCTFFKGTAAIPATALGGSGSSINIDSGASNVHRAFTVAVGALLGLANPVISMDIVKTGTPGAFNILSPFNVYYRIVGV